MTENTVNTENTDKKKQINVTFGQVNDKNINMLRKVNFQTFPVKYTTSFYLKIALEYTALSRFCFYNDIIIGAYTVRIQDFNQQKHAYILTFGVLQPYRRYGIGYKMMKKLEQEVNKDSDAVAIYLHMHVINQVGRKFYQKCGFIVQDRLQKYYTDLEQPHCLILRKKIKEGVLDYVRPPPQQNQKEQEKQQENK